MWDEGKKDTTVFGTSFRPEKNFPKKERSMRNIKKVAGTYFKRKEKEREAGGRSYHFG